MEEHKNEILQKYIKKIEKLHKKLEEETKTRFEINVYQPDTFEEIKVGDFYSRKSYIVHNALPKYKDLENKYTSINEIKEKIKSLYKNEKIDIHNGYIGVGKGAISKIASISVL